MSVLALLLLLSTASAEEPAWIEVTSPDGPWAVRVGGEYVGETPLQLELPAGTHRLAVGPRCAPSRRTLELSSGERREVEARPVVAWIPATFEPRGEDGVPVVAEVFASGRSIGDTATPRMLPRCQKRVRLVAGDVEREVEVGPLEFQAEPVFHVLMLPPRDTSGDVPRRGASGSPPYPRAAIKAKVEGTVQVRTTRAADGRTLSARDPRCPRWATTPSALRRIVFHPTKCVEAEVGRPELFREVLRFRAKPLIGAWDLPWMDVLTVRFRLES